MSKHKLILSDILDEMSTAVQKVLKSKWKKVKPLAELQGQFNFLTQHVNEVNLLYGKISTFKS